MRKVTPTFGRTISRYWVITANQTMKRKISESLYIRQLRPILNANEKSILFHLIDFVIVITLRDVFSNHQFRVIINNIVV